MWKSSKVLGPTASVAEMVNGNRPVDRGDLEQNSYPIPFGPFITIDVYAVVYRNSTELR